ncbi:MAG: hypothetical protein FJ148_13425 [Deltaproteobacteria bacterium]|nr:hypothetical protein [Deltaproteobacteria bacterium]
MAELDIPVLIVGAGPTGMMLGLLLQRLGVDARIVERRSAPSQAPAAHAINARTFEICRQAGVDMDAIAAASQSPADAGETHWVTRLGGEILGSLPYERQEDAVLSLTPTPLRNLSQHRFEPILLDALRASGAAEPCWGERWTSATQDADGVTSAVTDASGRTREIRSRWLLGADGAGSPVRKWLGVAQEGPERLQCFVMIHFRADLRPLVGARPGVLFWVNDPACSGRLVDPDGRHARRRRAARASGPARRVSRARNGERSARRAGGGARRDVRGWLRGISRDGRVARSAATSPLSGAPKSWSDAFVRSAFSGVGSTRTSRSPVARGLPRTARAHAPTTRKRTSWATNACNRSRKSAARRVFLPAMQPPLLHAQLERQADAIGHRQARPPCIVVTGDRGSRLRSGTYDPRGCAREPLGPGALENHCHMLRIMTRGRCLRNPCVAALGRRLTVGA